MKSRLLDYDSVTGMRRIFHPSDDGNSFVEQTVQDVSGRIDINKELFKESRSGYNDINRVASIPVSVYEGLIYKKILDRNHKVIDERAFKAWLNDPDNRAFRTRPGKV